MLRLLGLAQDELVHSKIIADLLNPCGGHSEGDKYVNLFLAETGIPKNQIQSVLTECSIGRVNLKEIEGGRIDILLKAKDFSLAIENKIGAYDQPKQLERYKNSIYQPKYVFYLTLTGHSPSKYSLGELNESEIICLSYKEHILTWLKKCKSISQFSNSIRVIEEYTLLVKWLVNEKGYKNLVLSVYENDFDQFTSDVINIFLKRITHPLQNNLDKDTWKSILFPINEELKYIIYSGTKNGMNNVHFGFITTTMEGAEKYRLLLNLGYFGMSKHKKNTKFVACYPLKRFENWSETTVLLRIANGELTNLIQEHLLLIRELLKIN